MMGAPVEFMLPPPSRATVNTMSSGYAVPGISWHVRVCVCVGGHVTVYIPYPLNYPIQPLIKSSKHIQYTSRVNRERERESASRT